MNIYETFPDFDRNSQDELLNLHLISFNVLEKGILGKGTDPFAGIRTNKTFQEISNEIALSTPFGKNSEFYRVLREIITGKIPKL